MWKICYEFFDEQGVSLGFGCRTKTYKYKGNAERMGKKYYGDIEHIIRMNTYEPITMRWWVEKVSDS